MVNREDLNRALRLVQRKAQGKRIVVATESPEVRRIYEQLRQAPEDRRDVELAQLPDYQEQVESGTRTRQRALGRFAPADLNFLTREGSYAFVSGGRTVGTAIGGGKLVDVGGSVITVGGKTPQQQQQQSPNKFGGREIQLPSVAERARGQFRKFTGISIPSERNIRTALSTPITTTQIATAPLRAIGGAGTLVGKGFVEPTLEFVGTPTIVLPERNVSVSQRATIGAEEPVINYPASEVISPRRGGQVAAIGTEVATLSALPAAAAGAILAPSGVVTALDKERTFEERFIGGAQAALGVGLVVSSASKALTTEREIFRQPVPKPQINTVSRVTPVQVGDKNLFFVKQYGSSVRPARYAEVNTLINELRGRPSKTVQIAKKDIRRFATPQTVLVDDKGNIIRGQLGSRRKGAGLTQFTSLEGAQQQLGMAGNQGLRRSLTSLEKKQLDQAIGPVIPEGSTIIRSSSGGSRYRVSRTRGGYNLIIPREGLRTTRVSGITISKELPSRIEGQRVYGTVSGVSDITKSATAGRGVQRVRGIVRVREPIDLQPKTEVFSPVRQVQRQTQTQAIKAALQVEQQATKQVTRQVPRSAPRATPSSAQFGSGPAPLGLVSRQDTTTPQINLIAPREQQKGNINISKRLSGQPPLSPDLLSISSGKTVIESGKEITKEKTLGVGKSLLTSDPILEKSRDFADIIQPIKLDSRSRSLERQAEEQRERLIQRSRQVQRQTTTTITPQITTTKTPTIPRVPPPIKIPIVPFIPLSTNGSGTVKDLLEKFKGQGFNVVTGVGKKRRVIGRNLPAFRALKLGTEYTSRNIEASFKLVKSGKTTKSKDIKPFKLSGMFRPGKKDPLRIVEKRRYRLDSPLERAQIKRSRKRKRKR